MRIILIGAGNLATQLGLALVEKGYSIVQVFSQTEPSAAQLAELLQSDYTTVPSEVSSDADIYFVALRDSAFAETLQAIGFGNKLVVHCSGSMPLTAITSYSENTGVFYPLQTFSKERKIDFGTIPVFIESGSDANLKILMNIGQSLSEKVSVLDSEKRKQLHIAAVFACNFVNHLYTLSAEILKEKEIPFEVIRPLVAETAAKVQEMEPGEAQTGPAVRYDENIIAGHLEQLRELPNFAEIYKLLSESIFNHHQKR